MSVATPSPSTATPPSHPSAAPFDPLRFCAFTTVAVLAWILGAPAMMMAMSALGIWAYTRAVRGGLTRTRCVLRSPRLVFLYLGAVFVAGAIAAAHDIARAIQR
jgi:hypothetical protein